MFSQEDETDLVRLRLSTGAGEVLTYLPIRTRDLLIWTGVEYEKSDVTRSVGRCVSLVALIKFITS